MLALPLLLSVLALFFCIVLANTKASRAKVKELSAEVERLSQLIAGDVPDAPKLPAVERPKAKGKAKAKDTALPELKKPTKVAAKNIPAPVISKPVAPKGPNFIEKAIANFSQNWIIWIAALSLSMGGLFFIRYGIENGILGPRARVASAIGFGILLIGAAEYLRRKETVGMHGWFSIPSIFATGGLASLFGAAVGAHILYDLTSQTVGFAFMALVSLLAVGLGILYGPVLAVLGILGAYAAPMIVSTGSGATVGLYAYYLLVLAAALSVERYMRWIWLSAFAVALALLQAALLLSTDLANEPYTAIYTAVVMLMATCIPAFGLHPKSGDKILAIASVKSISQHYPTILATATSLMGTILIVASATFGFVAEQSGIAALVIMLIWAVFWLAKAENLDEQAVIFAVGILTVCAVVSQSRYVYSQELRDAFELKQMAQFKFETAALLVTSAIAFVASFWRGGRSTRPLAWIAGGAIVPVAAFGLHYIGWRIWNGYFTDQEWAFGALLLTAMLAASAMLMLRSKIGLSRQGADIYAVGGLVATSFAAYFLIPDKFHAHTSAVLAVIALALVTRYKFVWTKHMIWAFVTVAGVLAMTDLFPDLMNQRKFSWMSLGVFALVAAPLCLGNLRSNAAKLTPIVVLFETAILVIGSGAVLIVLRHMFAQTDNIEYLELGFYATLALVMAGVQLRRAKFAESLQFARTILARIYMGGAGLVYLLALILTPLGFAGMRAYGIPPFSTVFLAYLGAPALLAFGFWKSDLITLPDRFRKPIYAVFTAISVFVLIQEVRHLWHGSTISFNKGVVTGELYSYTVLLLLLTIGFVFLALKRQDQNLRRYALIAAALTAAKVFTFDMGGMSGLPRATAFILLGLSLAGIGWLLQGVQKPDEPEADADDET